MRKILFSIGNRAHYARIRPIIEKIHNRCDYKLLIYDSAYNTMKSIIEEKYISKCIFLDTHVQGENLLTMVQSTGKAILLIAEEVKEYAPDIMVVIADRYEIMAAAIVARYMNICLVHIQGGEITGTIDDSIRHTVSKLSNYHFVSNSFAKNNLLKIGEEENQIYITGCPTLDIIRENRELIDTSALKFWHVKKIIDIPDYIVVNFHPVTTEYQHNSNYVNILYKSIKDFNYSVIWLLPNCDAGSDKVKKSINKIKKLNNKIMFFENFEIIQYISLLKYAKCIVGNSSVGIRESSFLGTPSVSIGSRQKGREISSNVVRCNIDSNEIKNKIIFQIKHGKYSISNLYGDGYASTKIAEKLLNLDILKEKFFNGGMNDK